ncbi:pyridoxal 5'-phosphate synthase glutaminase subunit PdxT [Candidatus Peregrinibacteria bacterium CG_4_10_14_0_2_um_filter_43_11]|nr:MAG: pyridoxal 5'-phosphate synthase glutaminase subunit PdxT [Candidatus Peregrinibacteria bacterium CG_4_10_14_0_2_um_filter_43_11]
MIGILALQGSFKEHIDMLHRLGAKTKEIRCLEDTKDIQACIIPGGESTTMMKMLKKTGLDEWLKKVAKKGMPLYGTCAGMIILSKGYLDLIDVEVERNAYGPQLASFEDEITLCLHKYGESDEALAKADPQLASFEDGIETTSPLILIPKPAEGSNTKNSENILDPSAKVGVRKYFQGIFIRAPKIKSFDAEVQVLAAHKKDPVLLRQNNIMIGSFHPELANETKIHEYFISMTS